MFTAMIDALVLSVSPVSDDRHSLPVRLLLALGRSAGLLPLLLLGLWFFGLVGLSMLYWLADNLLLLMEWLVS